MRHHRSSRAGRALAGAIATLLLAAGVLISSPILSGAPVADGGEPVHAPSAVRSAFAANGAVTQYFPFMVHDAQLVKPGWARAVVVLTIEIDPYIGIGGRPTIYPLSFDGNVNTPDPSAPGYTGFDFYNNDKWLYIASDVPFTKVRFVGAQILPGGYGGGLWGQGNPMGPAGQYFDGRNWTGFTVISDTTMDGGNSFAKPGEIEFVLGGDPMAQSSELGIRAYYIRGRFDHRADRIHLPEIEPWGMVHVQ